MTVDDINALIALAKKAGLRRIKTPEIEMEFGPAEAQAPQIDAMRKIAEVLASDTLTNEDALFMSSPQYVGDKEFKELLKRHTGQGS